MAKLPDPVSTPTVATEAEAKKIFRKMDKDGDGKLTKQELKSSSDPFAALSSGNPFGRAPHTVLQAVKPGFEESWTKFDDDNDGFLDEGEWVAMWNDNTKPWFDESFDNP